MQLILSILLFLNIICSPGTYLASEIKHDVQQNKAQIESIKNDPNLVKTILDKYQSVLPGITILDDGQLKVDDEK